VYVFPGFKDDLFSEWKGALTKIARKHKDIVISEGDWGIFKVIKGILNPLSTMTTELSKSDMPVSSLKLWMRVLGPLVQRVASLSVEEETPDVQLLKSIGTEMLDKYNKYSEVYSSFEVFACVVLDPRLKLATARTLFTPEELEKYMEVLKDTIAGIITVSAPADQPQVQSDNYYSIIQSFVPEEPQFVTELEQYLGLPKIPLIQSPREWWKSNETLFPALARLARRYLTIQATSVESERLFSIAGHVVSRRRTRLSMQTVRQLICLRSWTKMTEYNGARVKDDAEIESAESDYDAWVYDTDGELSE